MLSISIMNRFAFSVVLLSLCSCRTDSKTADSSRRTPIERIVVAPDGRGFVTEKTHRPFHPWGMNYGNAGRLMEDFWNDDWKAFAEDFRKLKAMGANVVRVHLQYGKFMNSPDEANAQALKQLAR